MLAQLDIIHKMYKEGIINGDAPTADDSSKYKNVLYSTGMEPGCKDNMGPKQWY